MFSDLVDSLHNFSNDPEMKVEFEGAAKKRREGSVMYTYSLDDVRYYKLLVSIH